VHTFKDYKYYCFTGYIHIYIQKLDIWAVLGHFGMLFQLKHRNFIHTKYLVA